jgi:hypothetical protein
MAQAAHERAQAFAAEYLVDRRRLDADPQLLQTIFAAYVNEGLHRSFGGNPAEAFELLASLAERSGAFAFTVFQMFAAFHLRSDPDEPLGIAMGHLGNRENNAVSCVNGVANGFVPWITGTELFPAVALGIVRSDGMEMVVRLETRERSSFLWGKALPLAALNSTLTRSVEILDQVITIDDIRSVRPAGEFLSTQRRSILWHSPLFVGIAAAAVQHLIHNDRVPAEYRRRAQTLAVDHRCRVKAAIEEGASASQAQRLRSESVEIAHRLVRLGMVAEGSAAAGADNPMSLLNAELQMLTSMGLTPDLRRDAFEHALPGR